MRTLVLAALLLLAPLALESAHAAEGTPGVIRVSPTNLTLSEGGSAGFGIALHNPTARALTLVLLNNTAPFDITFDVREFRLAPNGTVTTKALLGSGHATAGNYVVNLSAAEPPTTVPIGETPLTGHIPIQVRVVASTALVHPAVPVPAAVPSGIHMRVIPEDVNLTLGGDAIVQLRISNGGATSWTPALRVALEKGVDATLSFEPAPLAPGVTLDVPVLLHAAPDAREGDIRGYVASTDGAALPATFRVHLRAAPSPAASAAAFVEGGPQIPSAHLIIAAGVGAVGALGAGALVLRKRWPLLGAALYTRLLPNAVLEQPTRERIAKAIHDEPGVAFSDLARRLDLGAGTLTYHAQVLQRSGVVFSARDGQQRRFYPVINGFVPGAPGLAQRAMSSLASGPRGLAELATELGVSRQALHYHLRRMAARGDIIATGTGRSLRFERPSV